MMRFSYGARLQAHDVSGPLLVVQIFECNVPSNLTGDLTNELGALGQETLSP
jgi:hypothetical protein